MKVLISVKKDEYGITKIINADAIVTLEVLPLIGSVTNCTTIKLSNGEKINVEESIGYFKENFEAGSKYHNNLIEANEI